MAKKLSLLIAAVAILAFAVPSLANAAEVTYPAGTRAPVGQELQGTGTNVTLNSAGFGKITCRSIVLNAKITTNNGTTVEASGNNENPTTTNCFVEEEGRTVTVTNVNVTKLFANEANGPSGAIKKGTLAFTATLDLPAGVTCKFTGTEIPGHYVSTASPAVLTSTDTGGHITSTGGCGKATLEGSFSLHGPKGNTSPVVIH